MKTKQLSLYDAMPGYLGGIALRDKLGLDHLRKIGYSGAIATLVACGPNHMRRISQLGVLARRKKRENDPRTVKFWDGTTRRVIPYKKPRSKARKVKYVQILLDDNERAG